MCLIKDIIEIIQDVMPSIEFLEQPLDDSDNDYSTGGKFVLHDKPSEKKGILYITVDSDQLKKYKLVKKSGDSGHVTSYEIIFIRKLLNNLWPCLQADKTSLKNLSPYYIQLAICDFINKEKDAPNHSSFYVNNSKELNLLLNNLDIWSQRTYEGERVELVFVIPQSESCENGVSTVHGNKVNVNDVLMGDFMAPLTNIGYSAILLDRDCNIVNHLSLEENFYNVKNIVVPYIMNNFICSLHQKEGLTNCLVVALLENGDILLIRKGVLKFARRRGQWHVFNDTVLEYLLKDKTKLSDVIYKALLDASFAHTGACIGIWYMNKNCLTQDDIEHLSDMIDINDIYDAQVKECVENYRMQKGLAINKENNKFKRIALEKIIGEEMNITSPEFSRKKLQELLGIDGAMVVDEEGNIIAVGSIVKVEGGSASGGRLAAAQSLAKYGLAIKVSEDGKITGYNKSDTQKEVFNFG